MRDPNQYFIVVRADGEKCLVVLVDGGMLQEAREDPAASLAYVMRWRYLAGAQDCKHLEIRHGNQTLLTRSQDDADFPYMYLL